MDQSRVQRVNETLRTVRTLLSQREMSVRDLAAAIGLSAVTVENQIKGKCLRKPTAWRIERYFAAAIWTPVDEFAKILRCCELLGVDVRLTRFHELRSRAIMLRVPKARVLTSRAALIRAVLAHCDAK